MCRKANASGGHERRASFLAEGCCSVDGPSVKQRVNLMCAAQHAAHRPLLLRLMDSPLNLLFWLIRRNLNY